MKGRALQHCLQLSEGLKSGGLQQRSTPRHEVAKKESIRLDASSGTKDAPSQELALHLVLLKSMCPQSLRSYLTSQTLGDE